MYILTALHFSKKAALMVHITAAAKHLFHYLVKERILWLFLKWASEDALLCLAYLHFKVYKISCNSHHIKTTER